MRSARANYPLFMVLRLGMLAKVAKRVDGRPRPDAMMQAGAAEEQA